jgi:HEAT repeat protein
MRLGRRAHQNQRGLGDITYKGKTFAGLKVRKNLMFLRIIAVLFASVALVQAQTPSEKAWSILRDGAANKSSEKRAKALNALALLTQNKLAREMAENGLLDKESEVRAAAASALGQQGSAISIPKLKVALKDSQTEVVFAATHALFLLKDPAAYEIYYAVLMGERKSGEGLVESQMKMLKDTKALAKLGFEAGIGFIPFGGVSYGVFKAVTRDDASPVRAAAAQKLASDPDPKSGEALAKTAADLKWLVRAAIANAIAKRDDPALLSAVIPLLDDENDTVKNVAAAAVIRLSGKQKK